jgi:hypothetical protein
VLINAVKGNFQGRPAGDGVAKENEDILEIIALGEVFAMEQIRG